MPAPDRPVTETPARSGCTCPPRAGFGQERVHDTSNARCELVRARAVNPVDELGQIRLLLQSAGLGGYAPAAGVRELIAQRDQRRTQRIADRVDELKQQGPLGPFGDVGV